MSLKVSIVVLTYENFNNIEENIKSILSQTYTDYEVIIQDDGSDDFSAENIWKCIPLEYKDKFKVNTNEKNLGTVKNYNKALMSATGEIIVPLSQDDVFYDSSVVENIVSFFEKSNANVAFAKRIGRLSGAVYPRQFDVDILNDHSVNKLWMRLAFNNFISGSTLYWKKEYLINLGLFDEDYLLLEDHPILFKILERGDVIHYINILVIKYGENGVSSPKNIGHKLINDNVILHKKLSEKANNIIPSKFCRKYILFSERIWENENRLFFSLNFIDVYVFMIFSRLFARIKRIDVDEYRIKLFMKYIDERQVQ